MRVEGAILPAGDGSEVNEQAWCRLVDRRPEFRRPVPRQAINPFTRKPMVVRATPDKFKQSYDRTVKAVTLLGPLGGCDATAMY